MPEGIRFRQRVNHKSHMADQLGARKDGEFKAVSTAPS